MNANRRVAPVQNWTGTNIALAALVISLALTPISPANAQGVTDPVGDANPFFANGNRVYDLTFSSVTYTPTQAILYAEFANLIDLSDETNPDSLAGIWELDTDENAATGQPAFATQIGATPPVAIGSDFAVGFFGTQFGGILGMATVWQRVTPDLGFFAPIGNAPTQFGPNWVRTSVPLALLGGDDGRLNFFPAFNPIGGFGPTDFAPNLVGANDFIAPVASSAAAPEPTALTLSIVAAPLFVLVLRRRRS